MKIQVRLDRVYGRAVYYPVNQEAQALAQIAGSKTLTTQVMAIAKKDLGATIEFVTPRPEGL